MFYFAYGSNLLTERLRRRVPSANPLGRATLGGHQLRWHKLSDDGSGKCSVLETGREEDRVLGVLFRLDPTEKPRLDAAESLGVGYAQKEVDVVADEIPGASSPARAFTYVALAAMIDDTLEPYHWYKHLVVSGARHHGLCPDYVSSIENQPARPDSDPERVALAVSIFESAGVEWKRPTDPRPRRVADDEPWNPDRDRERRAPASGGARLPG